MLHAYQHTHTRIWRYRRLKQAANQDGGFLAKATFYHHSFHTHSELTRNQGDGRQSHPGWPLAYVCMYDLCALRR